MDRSFKYQLVGMCSELIEDLSGFKWMFKTLIELTCKMLMTNDKLINNDGNLFYIFLKQNLAISLLDMWYSPFVLVLSICYLHKLSACYHGNRNCLGQFREIPWNQTTDVHRGSTLITRVITWRWRYITWRWRHRNHVDTITTI